MALDRDNEIAGEILREFDRLAGKRGIWEKHWEDTALKVLPYYSTSFYSQGNTVPGQKRNMEQYDVTANSALWKFAAAMESMLTPASGKWHRLRATDPNLMKIPRVQLWFDQVNDLLFNYRYSPHSGFQANSHDGYVSLGAFGTTAMFIDEYNDPTAPQVKGLRYRHVFLGELYFACNYQGQVDTVYRRFKMTLRQIAQKWGVANMPDGYRTKLENSPEEEVFVIHAVKPNKDFDPKRFDAKGKPFSSHYVLKETNTLMEVGGYRVFPYATARYITAPGELYGRSPAMNVLPSIQVLNEEKKMLLKQGHRASDPIVLVHDDGILDGFSLKPGAVNIGGVSADGRPLVHTLQTGNIQVGKEMMDDERAVINDAFLVTLFQILVDSPQMTATEVLERAREKGALLSPTMGRFQSESLGAMITREFDLLAWQGLLPPAPPEIVEAQAVYKVEYDAPLNRAMRSDEASGFMRIFDFAAQIAAQTQDPSVMDNFAIDRALPELADIGNVPFRFMATPEEIAAKRQGRQQQQATQQVTQALPGMAAMMKSSSPQGTSPNPGQPSGQ